MTTLNKLEQQQRRFALLANGNIGGNIFLDTKHTDKILRYLLKLEKISLKMYDKLQHINCLEEFKQKLRELGIVLNWSGDAADKPDFEYKKKDMIDGSSLSNNGKLTSIGESFTPEVKQDDSVDFSKM